ncbi:MAG: YdcF family protein [Chitinophagales bacterium]|nr:YdcF family protein [Chitinophagales bacterium]
MKKLFGFIVLIVMLWAVFKTFHAPILRTAAQFLIHEDSLQKADALVVLSGSAFERGNKGAELLQNGFAQKIICPGGNLDLNYFILFGDSIYECDITKKKILQSGVSDSSVVCIYDGTSTQEEAQAVRAYCLLHQIKSIIVISTYFHTARVKRVYSKIFDGSGITIIIRGAKSVHYDENQWWHSEEGLISFNNEWMKTFYYFLKH